MAMIVRIAEVLGLAIVVVIGLNMIAIMFYALYLFWSSL